MSAQWIGYFLDNDDKRLHGTLLLIAIAIADHADSDGKCWPGTELLSRKIRKEKRQTQTLIKKLSELGYVDVIRGRGRGHLSSYQLKKVHPTAPFNEKNTTIAEEEKVHSIAPFSDDKRCNSDAEKVQPTAPFTDDKRCNFDAEKVQFLDKNGGAYKDEPFKPFISKRADEASVPTGSKNGDERSKHPAIAAIREIASIYPPKEIWDVLIAEIGDNPDTSRLRNCFIEWRGRGFRPINYAWAREWYCHGIPNHHGALGRAATKPKPESIRVESESQPAVVPRPRRPPDPSTPEERELFRAVLDLIAKQIPFDPFNSWFKQIIFDGLNADKNAFKVRADQITHDWVREVYSETIYEALTGLGLGEFTFEWEIETGVFETVDTT